MGDKKIELAHGLCKHATLTQKLLYESAIRTNKKNCDVSHNLLTLN